ncbi:MAG: hypothetical protein V4642_07570 [Bacteroidota bacterium]
MKILFSIFFSVLLGFAGCTSNQVVNQNGIAQTYAFQDSSFTVSLLLKKSNLKTSQFDSTSFKITVENNSKENFYFPQKVEEFISSNEYSIICGAYIVGGPEHPIYLKKVSFNESIIYDIPKSFLIFKEDVNNRDFSVKILYLPESEDYPKDKNSEIPIISRDDFQIKFQGLNIKPQISFQQSGTYFNFFKE